MYSCKNRFFALIEMAWLLLYGLDRIVSARLVLIKAHLFVVLLYHFGMFLVSD